jgi:predicted GIY-YIG superfamily endonuclease
MEVCEVCGSFLIVNDAQARVEEHISGKQHMGYAKLRSALEDIRVLNWFLFLFSLLRASIKKSTFKILKKKKRAEEFEKREKERSSSRSDRHRDRDRRDRR